VHDARAVLDGDELVGDDAERIAVDGEQRERRFVVRADEVGDVETEVEGLEVEAPAAA
jgi:hypothetical protein